MGYSQDLELVYPTWLYTAPFIWRSETEIWDQR